MKLSKVFVFVLFLVSRAAVGQLEVLKQNVLELEQQVFHKAFSKKWVKTKKVEWEKNLLKSTTIMEINVLFNEFSDLLAQSAQVSLGNSDAENVAKLAQYLLKVNGVIKADLVPKWSTDARNEWENRLNKIIQEEETRLKKQKEKEEKERQMRRLSIISAAIKGFDVNFKLIFEDSKKNSFKNTRDSAPVGADKKSGSKVNFSGAINQVIELSSEGGLQFSALFSTEEDEQIAEKMVEEMIAEMLKILPVEYKKVNRMDDRYIGNNKFVLEYTGAKFSDTAKNPTIIIGVRKDKFTVSFELVEPVFGK
jgi:hypothetical protein